MIETRAYDAPDGATAAGPCKSTKRPLGAHEEEIA
jgi:hypothetical protein